MSEEFKKRMYLGDFTGWGDGSNDYNSPNYDSVTSQFRAGDIKEPTYVWAYYDIDGYEGSATVIYKQGRKWYQVYGSHCSCYGLEDQWKPEEFDPALHLKAVKEGKSLVSGWGRFDAVTDWLKWVAKEEKKKKKARAAA